jgi:D-glycero-D-manno-heptose 1,7-bisphosphate phosphatase
MIIDHYVYKAVFFDRDGVLNKERKDYVKSVDELEIFENIGEIIKKLKNNGFKIIVITNQSAINRNLTNDKKIIEIHNSIQKFLKNYNTSIDRFYYCPHLPNENCDCRKPKSGLLIKAASDMDIDLQSSWMVGDNDTDIIAGENVGCKSIKIKNNHELENAVNVILN